MTTSYINNGLGDVLTKGANLVKRGFAHGSAGGTMRALKNAKNAKLGIGKKIVGGAGIAAGQTARFARSNPGRTAAIAGGAGLGAGFATGRSKKATTNEGHMTEVLINNSEQLAVEHRVMMNRLNAQMVDNGIGSMIGKAASAVSKKASQIGKGFKSGFGGSLASAKSSSRFIRAGGAAGRGAKSAVGLGQSTIGKLKSSKGFGKAREFVGRNPKTALAAGAAAGGAGAGMAMRRKSD